MPSYKKNGLIEKYSKQDTPLVAFIELTNRCNLKCIHCMRAKKNPSDLPKKLFTKTIDQLAELGTLSLNLTGGEPLLHKNFFYLLACAKERSFNIKISSNCTFINKNNLFALKRCRPIAIQTSIYGASRIAHDAITRTKGSYRKTLKAIKMLQDAGIPIFVHMTVMRNNFSDLERIMEVAEREKWKFSYNFIIYPRDDASLGPLCHRITDEQLKIAQSKKLINKKDFLDEVPKNSQIRKMHDLANISCRISSSGQVFPSGTLRLEMSSLKKMSFFDIWFKSPVAHKLRNLKAAQFECLNCDYFSSCSWDIGLAYAEHKKITSTPKEWCRFARS